MNLARRLLDIIEENGENGEAELLCNEPLISTDKGCINQTLMPNGKWEGR